MMSIVRENLLTEKGYRPYCGDWNCKAGMPRAVFKNDQFECRCGWRSEFEPDFIKKVVEFNQ